MNAPGEKKSQSKQRPPLWKRQLLVYPRIQIWLILYPVLLTIALVAMTKFSQELPIFNSRYAMVELIAILYIITMCSIFFGIYMSNQVMGPIYRLRQCLKDVADGSEPRDIQFRKGDYLYDMAADYNRVVKRLRDAENKK